MQLKQMLSVPIVVSCILVLVSYNYEFTAFYVQALVGWNQFVQTDFADIDISKSENRLYVSFVDKGNGSAEADVLQELEMISLKNIDDGSEYYFITTNKEDLNSQYKMIERLADGDSFDGFTLIYVNGYTALLLTDGGDQQKLIVPDLRLHVTAQKQNQNEWWMQFSFSRRQNEGGR